jgi:hypothetical protein
MVFSSYINSSDLSNEKETNTFKNCTQKIRRNSNLTNFTIDSEFILINTWNNSNDTKIKY